MLEINLTIDTKAIDRFALLTEKNLRFATGRAMAATVRATEQTLKQDLAKTSGGPIEGGATRWTLGGVYTRRPSPNRLEAEVGLRSDQSRAAGRYISVLTRGGAPRRKAVDTRAGGLVNNTGLTIVPTRRQRVDAKGNVTLAAYTKALASASYIRDGRQFNRNAGSRFFIIPIKGTPGRMGVFERTSKPGKGRYGSWEGTQMRFTLEPNPKPRRSTYDLTGDLQRSAQVVWPGEIQKWLRAELAQAGFR
jgi:hypothetical protein